MKSDTKGTFITGLWKQEKDGKTFYIGRINPSLNAIIVENKNRRSNKNDPTHILYFYNGSLEDAKKKYLGTDNV